MPCIRQGSGDYSPLMVMIVSFRAAAECWLLVAVQRKKGGSTYGGWRMYSPEGAGTHTFMVQPWCDLLSPGRRNHGDAAMAMLEQLPAGLGRGWLPPCALCSAGLAPS